MSTDVEQGAATVTEMKPGVLGFEQRIANLVKIEKDAIEFERERKAIAKDFKLRFQLVDASIERARQGIPPAPDSSPDTQKMTPRQKLLQLVDEQGMVFWRNSDSTAYVTVPYGGHIERHQVQGSSFKLLLRLLYGSRWAEATKSGAVIPGAISETTMAEVMSTLEAMALNGEVREARVRVTKWQGAIWIDLCDDTWRLIKVMADGWDIVESADVPLVRTYGMMPLPEPAYDPKAFENLVSLINVAEPDDQKLIVAWMVAALWPSGPYPVLAIDGEQGSAKSSICRTVRNLVDPNKAGLRALPKNEDDMLISATNSRVLGFENISFLTSEVADAMCRISTGAGFGKRKLHTDAEETILAVCNPLLLNGIPSLLARADLADRAIAVTLPRITETQRKTEAELNSKFEAAAPGILAWLLGGMMAALRNLPTLKLDHLPRMADFAMLACAAAPAFGWMAEDLLEAIKGKRMALGAAAVEADEVAQAVETMAQARSSEWKGTASDLLAELNKHAPATVTLDKAWPKDAIRLSARLRRVAPALLLTGVDVSMPNKPEKIPGQHKAVRIIAITYNRPPLSRMEMEMLIASEIEFHAAFPEPEFDFAIWGIDISSNHIFTAIN